MLLPMLQEREKNVIKPRKVAKINGTFLKDRSIFHVKFWKFLSPLPLRSKTLFTPSLPSKMSMVYLPLSFSVGSLIWSQSCSPVTPDLTLSEVAILASLMDKWAEINQSLTLCWRYAVLRLNEWKSKTHLGRQWYQLSFSHWDFK